MLNSKGELTDNSMEKMKTNVVKSFHIINEVVNFKKIFVKNSENM